VNANAGPAQPVDGDDIEQIIATIWEDLLGVSNVGSDESFFDLGGTSLIAARMFALITQRCGRRLPISTLVNAPTIAQLADVVRDVEHEAKGIVEIQKGDGSRPPLFLIHAEGGHVLMYRELAHFLGEDWTVYGIQSRGLDGSSEPSDSIEEMASRYISEMREIQPSGPYFLGGWCLGGMIGIEMASQLEASGERVDWLGMIQNRHPNYWKQRDQAPRVKQSVWRAGDRFAIESSNLSGLDGLAKLQYLVRKARRALTQLWARMPIRGKRSALVTELVATEACTRAHRDAYWSYEASPYGGRVAVLVSTDQPRGVQSDPTLGWGPFLQGPTELYEVLSHHGNVIHGERSRIVADIISSSIDALLSSQKTETDHAESGAEPTR
jgi:thioesterase domain-containing protein/acyl carrier protein